MNMPFGPNDPNSLPALLGRLSPGMTPGPVPAQQLTPGFRAPGGGAPGMPQIPQMPGMGLDPTTMAMMAMAMKKHGGAEDQVNKTLDAAPPGGQSDPMAQAAAQSADMQGPFAWLKTAMKGLF